MGLVFWKKNLEIKKSLSKKIAMFVMPILFGALYFFVFKFTGLQMAFFLPLTVCTWMNFILYCIDDIACASTLKLVGIKAVTRWMTNILYCIFSGLIVSTIILGIIYGFGILYFEPYYIFIFVMTIPLSAALIGLSTIHFATNSRKSQVFASVAAIYVLLSEISYKFLSVYITSKTPIYVYVIIAGISLIMFVGQLMIINGNDDIETLVNNSRIYIEGYDKNFFQE